MKNQRIKERAVWIFDSYFKLPGIISISSFLERNKIPITIIYCESSIDPQLETLINTLSTSIQIEYFSPCEAFKLRKDYNTIVNRLARMEVMRKFNNEIIYLFDADVIVDGSLNDFFKYFRHSMAVQKIQLSGCIETSIAHHNYLYFRTTDKSGREVKVPGMVKDDIYKDIFGIHWRALLGTPGFNNGVLAFYACGEMADKWEEYYRKGLAQPLVNSSDDQLPMIAACNYMQIKLGDFDIKYNSLGQLSGDYKIFHAFSNAWQFQFNDLIHGKRPEGRFAEIAEKYISKQPKWLIDEFQHQLEIDSPSSYLAFTGSFKYKHLLRDIFSKIESGNILEIGSSTIKSVLYMSEFIIQNNLLINLSFKYSEISGITTQDYFEFENTLQNVYPKFNAIFYSNEDELELQNKNFDFIFVNTQDKYELLNDLLETYYPLLNEGGILAGYDYTAQDGLSFGNECVSYNFSQKHELDLRIDFDIFIMHKREILEDNVLIENDTLHQKLVKA